MQKFVADENKTRQLIIIVIVINSLVLPHTGYALGLKWDVIHCDTKPVILKFPALKHVCICAVHRAQ